MKLNYCFTVCFFLLGFQGFAQKTDSLINQLDSAKKVSDSGKQVNDVEPDLYTEKTKITPKIFFVLLADDFKQQALAPFKLNKQRLIRDAVIVGITVGVSFLDKPIQRWAVNFRENNPRSQRVSKAITNLGGVYEVVPLAAIAVTGFITKNEKLRVTTALATQSYITATVWSTLMKAATGRIRPDNALNSNGNLTSRFHGPFYKIPNGDNSAFPSGHAALAFAAATVYAKEYKNIPGIPVLSYGIASLITLSRITENRHWATDLIGGALLGFACGTQVVNNYHRFARIKRKEAMELERTKTPKGSLTYSLNYSHVMGFQAGCVYTIF